jgi:hypothetical protein
MLDSVLLVMRHCKCMYKCQGALVLRIICTVQIIVRYDVAMMLLTVILLTYR